MHASLTRWEPLSSGILRPLPAVIPRRFSKLDASLTISRAATARNASPPDRRGRHRPQLPLSSFRLVVPVHCASSRCFTAKLERIMVDSVPLSKGPRGAHGGIESRRYDSRTVPTEKPRRR